MSEKVKRTGRYVPHPYGRKFKRKLRNELKLYFGQKWSSAVAERAGVHPGSVTRIFSEDRYNPEVMNAAEAILREAREKEAEALKHIKP